jgi:hypothetical protein
MVHREALGFDEHVRAGAAAPQKCVGLYTETVCIHHSAVYYDLMYIRCTIQHGKSTKLLVGAQALLGPQLRAKHCYNHWSIATCKS